ncbi:hypothetical protein J2Z60_002012 [Lactobacillus colini]|uniref:MFS transporter n=1 Tax=Lactobacillus colini TaxID=1819254 RepID=A0ABS4MGK9_9LACO|nr:MFS transporter [Lactobacillus colini]MBP2058821.1 hypothetical protein [Lactobacillus colini]
MKRKINNKNLYILLSGRIATNIADSLFYMAILWSFKEKFQSPIIVSLIFTIESVIDMFSFSLGPIIDRIKIKKLLKVVSFLQAIFSVIAVGIILLNGKKVVSISLLLLIYLLSTIGSTMLYPSEEKILPTLVNHENLIKANALFQMSYRTLDLFLDALATILITLVSVPFTLIISGVIFALALALYTSLGLVKQSMTAIDEEVTCEYLTDLKIGWNILEQEGRILALIIPFAVTNLFYGVASVGLPYFASKYLTNSAISYGSLGLASSIGGLIGAMLVHRFSFGSRNLSRFVVVCLVLAGISVIGEPALAVRMPVLVFLLFASSSLWIAMMNINFETLVQKSFSPNLLGRIETINSSIISCMIPIGSLLGGIIVKYVGVNWAIYLQGIAELVTGIYYLVIFNKRK